MKLYDKAVARVRDALDASLDAAAPDGDSWLAGKSAFWWAVHNDDTFDIAIEAALDAAAPDGKSWMKGREVFNRNLSFIPQNLWQVLRFRDDQYSPKQQSLFYRGAHE